MYLSVTSVLVFFPFLCYSNMSWCTDKLHDFIGFAVAVCLIAVVVIFKVSFLDLTFFKNSFCLCCIFLSIMTDISPCPLPPPCTLYSCLSSVLCLHGIYLFFARCMWLSQKDLIPLRVRAPSFCLSPFCSLSSLCRGGALSDGWSAQTDPDPAWGDGEHVVMLVALLKSALLKPRVGNQTDCGPVGLESQYIFWYLILSSARSSLEASVVLLFPEAAALLKYGLMAKNIFQSSSPEESFERVNSANWGKRWTV